MKKLSHRILDAAMIGLGHVLVAWDGLPRGWRVLALLGVAGLLWWWWRE